MTRVVALLFVCALASPTTARASGTVAFGILDGRVSLIANNATIAEILTAWSAIGKTRIVNIERLATTRITMELLDVSELEALDILLRSAIGYVAVPRASFDEHLSRFDRIAIMPIKGAVAAPETRAMMAGPPGNRFVAPATHAQEIANDDRTDIEPIDPEITCVTLPAYSRPTLPCSSIISARRANGSLYQLCTSPRRLFIG